MFAFNENERINPTCPENDKPQMNLAWSLFTYTVNAVELRMPVSYSKATGYS